MVVSSRSLVGQSVTSRVRFKRKFSLGCAGLALLSACAGGGGQRVETAGYYEAHAAHDYSPPGPPSDPWGPYIQEASSRFDVPQAWIRQVMRIESGGQEYIDGQLTVSAAGAMGLMQLEPATYQDMASQYNLGTDPFNPHDNIMAGTAYIHVMYQVYGSPGFLAAYNAGPGRLNSYMNYHTPLPDETVNYVAMIAPHIQGYYPAQRSDADQLALNTLPITEAPGLLPRGFVPDAPGPVEQDYAAPAVQVASIAPVAPSAPAIYAQEDVPAISAPLPPPPPSADQSSVYTPEVASVEIAPPPPPRHEFSIIPAAMADTPPPPPAPIRQRQPHTGWAIQVGAYNTSSNARAALGIAELSAVRILVNSRPMVVSVQAEGHIKYRARFVGLPHEDAINACSRLSGGPTGCVVLSPEEQS